jgi:hypothetical protein
LTGGFSNWGSLAIKTSVDALTSKALEGWSSGSADSLYTRSISQTIRDIPNGLYIVKMGAFAVDQASAGETGSVELFAGADVAVPVVVDAKQTASGSLTADQMNINLARTYTLQPVIVTDGSLTLGIRETKSHANWIAFDNVKLFYAGSDVKTCREQLTVALPSGSVSGQMNATVKKTMDDALKAWNEVAENETLTSLVTRYRTLKTALADATVSVEGYKVLSEALAYVTNVQKMISAADTTVNLKLLSTAISKATALYDDGSNMHTGTSTAPLTDANQLREAGIKDFLAGTGVNLTENVADATTAALDATTTSWTASSKGNHWYASGEYPGSTTKTYLDSWAASGLKFTVTQRAALLPAGLYMLSAEGRTDGHGFALFAKSGNVVSSSFFENKGNKDGTLGQGWSTNYLLFTLSAPDSVIIGISTEAANYQKGTDVTSFDGSWTSATNFSLYNLAVNLDENGMYTATYLPSANIHLHRTLATSWTPLCLPFALSKTQTVTTFGEGAQVAALTSIKGDSLFFTTNDGRITACSPVLIKVPVAGALWNVARSTYWKNAARTVSVSDGDNKAELKGTFMPLTAEQTTVAGATCYTLTGEAFVPYSSTAVNNYGYSAYLTYPSAAGVQRFVVVVDGMTTSIRTPQVGGISLPADIYDLSGRMVRKQATDLSDLPHGVYVVNGRKVVLH